MAEAASKNNIAIGSPELREREVVVKPSPVVKSKETKDKRLKDNPLTLDQIANFFRDENDFLTSKGVLPLISPYKEVVTHYLPISDDTLKQIQTKLDENPFSQFNLNPNNDAPKETFLFIFNQLWSSLHQLSQPLFQIANHYSSMNAPELLNILKRFSNSLSQYQQSFFVYKNDSFRFNKANFFTIIETLNAESTLTQTYSLAQYITTFFHFLYVATNTVTTLFK